VITLHFYTDELQATHGLPVSLWAVSIGGVQVGQGLTIFDAIRRARL
jgi:hypothetical protein